MNNPEFFEKLREIIQQAIDKTTEFKNEKDEIEKKIYSKKYTVEYVRANLYPARIELGTEIRKTVDRAEESAKKLISSYQEELRERDSLKPEELTDDLKLLQSGLPLTDRDLKDILKRCEGNRTMTVLVLRYAEEHDIQGIYIENLNTGTRMANEVGGLWSIVRIVFEHIMTGSINSTIAVYDKLFGDSSELATIYNRAE